MSETRAHSSAIKVEALWQQLAALEDGSMAPAEREKLMAVLEESRAARHLYMEYFAHSVALKEEARFLFEQGQLPVLVDSLKQWRRLRRSLLAAAAVVTAAAIIVSIIMIRLPESGRLTADAVGGTKWMVDGEVQVSSPIKRTVAAGSTVQVLSGTLKLKDKSGAAMVIQGPARVSFPKLDKPVISMGWMWIDSGKSNQSFEVSTPDLLVRDIGTCFGVRVPEYGAAELHVIAGKVDVRSKSKGKSITLLEPEKQGVAIPVVGNMSRLALARDPFPEIDKLLAAQSDYPTTVSSQNPAGYWRMEETLPGVLANEVPGGIVGRSHALVKLGDPGPNRENGLGGLGRSNPSIYLPRLLDGAPLVMGKIPVHTGGIFQDDFETPQNFTHGVADTIWHGVINAKSSLLLDANTSTPGLLHMKTPSYKGWAADRNNAPFLYMNVAGDFDARVQVMDQTSGDYSVAALMARLGGSAANDSIGENYMSVNSNRFGSNWLQARTLQDGGQNDSIGSTNSLYPRHLRLTRESNTFRTFESTDGINWKALNWGGLRGALIGVDLVRDDLDGLPLQVGLWQGSFSNSGHTADFDNFSIKIALDPSAPRSSGESARVARKEGAVSFWMRRESIGYQRAILWSAGDGPADASIQAYIYPDGRVGFFMEDGRHDVLITTTETIDTGTWHHFAVSWSPSVVELYLDGKQIAREAGVRAMQQGSLPELRFGSGPASQDTTSFNGWLDDAALWNRALSQIEVQQQYRSASGD